MALNIRIILLVLLGAAIALFLIQNVAETEIQFLLWSVTMRRSTLVLLVLGIGVVIGWILGGIHSRSRRREQAKYLPSKSPQSTENGLRKSDSFDQSR